MCNSSSGEFNRARYYPNFPKGITVNTYSDFQVTLYRWMQMLGDGKNQEVADEIHEALADTGFYTRPIKVPPCEMSLKPSTPLPNSLPFWLVSASASDSASQSAPDSPSNTSEGSNG